MSSTVAERLRDGASVEEVFPELELVLRPKMVALARRFAPSLGIDPEDAVQEARMAVFRAFEGYDYEKSKGGVKAFAHRAIKNALVDMFYKATTQGRTPHTIYQDGNGDIKIALHKYLPSLEQLMAPEEDSASAVQPASSTEEPDDRTEGERMAAKMRVMTMRLGRRLKRIERDVYRCKTQPPEAFQLYLRNIGLELADVTNAHIGRYLGVGKNTVDYALHKIKGHFAQLAEEPEFSDMIRDLVEEGKWPMIYNSDKANDVEFVRRILNCKKLEPVPAELSRDIQVNGTTGRIIEKYHWGVVVHLKYRSREATLVIEGRFNPLSGEVLGEHGYWKPITETVPWYKDLAKELKA